MSGANSDRISPKLSRRYLVTSGAKIGYAVPMVAASFRLQDLRAQATSVSNDGGEDNRGNKNLPPVCIPGEGFEVVDDDGDGYATVTVDGSASTDTDGSIASYLWTLKGEWVANTQVASVTLPIGTHRLTLSVKDNKGASSEARIRIRVKAGEVTAEETPVSEEPPVEDPVTGTVKPAAPHNLKANQKFGEIALTWDVEAGSIPPYRVYRFLDDGIKRKIEEIKWVLVHEEPLQVFWRDIDVRIASTYLYTVRSFDGVQESENSNIVTLTVRDYETEPVAPTEIPVVEATEEVLDVKAEPTEVPIVPDEVEEDDPAEQEDPSTPSI